MRCMDPDVFQQHALGRLCDTPVLQQLCSIKMGLEATPSARALRLSLSGITYDVGHAEGNAHLLFTLYRRGWAEWRQR